MRSRFPLPALFLISITLYGAPLLMAYQENLSFKTFPMTNPLFGFLSVALSLLCLRMVDDLSDMESDRLFYPTRPLPSGDAKLEHIKIFILLSTAIILLSNLIIGGLSLLLISITIFLYTLYYLLKKRITNLFVSALSVNLIFLIIPLYAAGIRENGIGLLHILLSVFLYSSVTAHEIAHNIKSPEDEREGLKTFSILWGGRKAALISCMFFLLSVISGLFISIKGNLHYLYLFIYFLSVVFLSYRYARLIASPVTEISRKFYVEGFLYHLTVFFGIILDLLIFNVFKESFHG